MPVAPGDFADDGLGIDDDHAVELQPLRVDRGEVFDTVVTVAKKVRGTDYCDQPGSDLAADVGDRVRDVRRGQRAAGGVQAARPDPRGADRAGRMQVRCELLEQTGRQLHDFGGSAVVHRELVARHRVGRDVERLEDAVPCRCRAGADCLRFVAREGERLCRASPSDRAPLHRRKVLGLVDHDVAVAHVGRAQRRQRRPTSNWWASSSYTPCSSLAAESPMSAVVAYVTLHSRHSSRSLPDASPGQVLERAPAARAVGQPLFQDPLGHVVERRSSPAGAPRSRRDGPEEDVGLVEEGHVGLAPSVVFLVRRQCSASSSSAREDVAPGIRETPGRREQTAHEHFGSEQRATWRALPAPARLGRSRRGAAARTGPLPDRCGRSDGRARGRCGTRLPVRAGEGAPPAGRPPLCVVDRRLRRRRRWRRGRRGRPRGGTAPPTARCPPAAPARERGPPGRGRRPCGGRP